MILDWLLGSLMPHGHRHHKHHEQRLGCIMLVVTVGHPHHHHRHHRRYEIFLTPNRRSKLANITVSVGHTINFTLVYLDQLGNPMLVTPTPDAAPTWTDTTPATGTLTPGGNTASEIAIAAGTDTVSVALAVATVAFTASIGVTVTAVPQVLTSVQIAATDVTAPPTGTAAAAVVKK
jgi:hypothetical protein